MFKIGLTGGIGCGKTTVSNLFADLGVPIIDADEISRHLTQTSEITKQQIKNTFGFAVFLENGDLNRAALKTLIFQNSTAKKQLEAILHPLIFAEISMHIQQLSTPYCIVSLPLLFETNAQHLVDRILVIDCDLPTQIARVQRRDNLPFEQIQAIIDSQVSATYRKTNADDLLNNTKTPHALAKEVKKLHNFYLSLST